MDSIAAAYLRSLCVSIYSLSLFALIFNWRKVYSYATL